MPSSHLHMGNEETKKKTEGKQSTENATQAVEVTTDIMR